MDKAVDQSQAPWGEHARATAVARRRVFYIPGYDPFPARRYRELYRREGRDQARISGYGLTQHPPRAADRFGWEVTGEIDGQTTRARIEVLGWSDIVQGSMQTGVLATYWQMLRTAWVYFGSGAFWRLARLRKGPAVASLYPVGILLGQLVVALVAGGLITWIIAALLALGFGDSLAFDVAGVGAGVWCAALILRRFQAADHRILAYYLMHDYAFTASRNGANPPELEARMAQFATIIGDALQEDSVDEVLVVGHSSGAHIAVSVLSDLIRAGRVRARGPVLSLLTLGQVVPMVSFLPGARRLRADLAFLSTQDAIAWVDVSAPGDGCAFALCDPVAVSGMAGPGKRWPLVVSAAFTQTLSPQRWKELRWQFFRLHFQYLSAFDQPGDYDYFQITAGPMTLAARYAGRPPSKTRVERAASGYTST